ncbi:MFS transporter, partial [Achromobacter sp. AGC25]
GFGHLRFAGGVLLVAWGLAYGGVSVSLQAWMMRAAPDAVEAATALFVAMFNLGIAAGSLLGVPSVDALGLRVNLWLAAACMLLPAGALWAWRQPRRTPDAGSTCR